MLVFRYYLCNMSLGNWKFNLNFFLNALKNIFLKNAKSTAKSSNIIIIIYYRYKKLVLFLKTLPALCKIVMLVCYNLLLANRRFGQFINLLTSAFFYDRIKNICIWYGHYDKK